MPSALPEWLDAPADENALHAWHRIASGLPAPARELGNKAYLLAAHVHAGQRRHEGVPYIIHPVRVARTLAMTGHGARDVIAAALLHDVIEDYAGGEDAAAHLILPATNSTVLAWVRLLSKLPDKLGGDEIYFRRIARALPAVRALKLADRLDNLRFIAHRPPATVAAYWRETDERVVPIAHSLGADPIASLFLDWYRQNAPAA